MARDLIMLRFGNVKFNAIKTPFEEKTGSQSYNWGEIDLIGGPPALHATGYKPEEIQITGEFDSRTGGKSVLNFIAQLKSMGKSLSPYLLIDSLGYNRGRYVITAIDETEKDFILNGIPLTIKFTLKLKRYTAKNKVTGEWAYHYTPNTTEKIA